ncbi:MAG: carboxypeptidase-like regulatory domain-containing protein, partial [Bacteroidales bacterium]|nr:carboxypeptidase-like regulatory domain-containing protein [Bacteroidales bacterium]
MKRFFIILILGLCASHLFSQVVTGRVIDAEGEPLVGANIVEKGTTNGTSADENGRFSITTSQKGKVLLFSFVGYVDFEYTITKTAKVQ